MKKIVSVVLVAAVLIFSIAVSPAQAATAPLSRAAMQQLLTLLLQELALLEQQLATETAASATSTPAVITAPALPPETTFDPQSLVGILCYYNVTVTNPMNGEATVLGDQQEIRGSGVIINTRGDILTNRHVLTQPNETTTVSVSGQTVTIVLGYALDHCEVGQLPADTHLPTASEIQSLNPYVQIPVLAYNAQPTYLASDTDAMENDLADFAILHITGLATNASLFGITAVPKSFPYARLLAINPYVTASTTIPGDVLTYGFPGDVTSGQGNFFGTLTMTGSVGHVTEIDGGENLYNNIPFIIRTDMEISHGRSGSPLIWHGYVIGLVTFFVGNNRTDSGSVASDAIIKTLQSLGYLP